MRRSRYQFDQEAFAEAAAVVVLAGVFAAVAAVGMLFAGLASQIILVYAIHGKPDEPEAWKLKRALQILVGSWAVAVLVPLTSIPLLAVIGMGAASFVTLAFPFYVLTLGQRLGMPEQAATTIPSGDLDDYLDGLEEAPSVIPFVGAGSASGLR